MSSKESSVCEDVGSGATLNSSESKLIARGIIELETRLKNEFSEKVIPANEKILNELAVIQQSFGRIFNVLERHDTLLQDIVQKFTQQSGRMEKAFKEQEQMRKKLEERSMPPQWGIRGGSNNFAANGGRFTRGSVPVGANTRNERVNRQARSTWENVGGNTGIGESGFGGLPHNIPPPPPNFQSPQQFSSTTKMWTRRGPGEFTSDEDSDDENENSRSPTENEWKTPIRGDTSIAGKTPVVSDTVAISETVVVSKTITVNETVTNKDDVSTNGETQHDNAKTSAPTINTPRSSTRDGLSGGFGNFRRGKPAALIKPVNSMTSDEDKTKVSDCDKVNTTLSNPDSNIDNSLNVRPLTVDEMEVISKTGRKMHAKYHFDIPQRTGFMPIRSPPSFGEPSFRYGYDFRPGVAPNLPSLFGRGKSGGSFGKKQSSRRRV